jgi:hypothetical protein
MLSVQYAPMAILLGDTDHIAASVAGESGWVAGTHAPLPAIEMVTEGTEKLCRDPEQRHGRLPVGLSEAVTKRYASRLRQSRELWVANP